MVTPLDGNPPEGEQAQPTPAASQEQGQLSKEDVQALVQRLDAAEKQLKGLQKGTDKQIGQVRDDVKRILELSSKGLDESQIQRELLIDRVLTGQNAPVAPVEGKQPVSEPGFDVETVVKAMDFPENDVAVAAVKKAYANNPQTLISELAKLKITQASVKPAGPAQALPPSGGHSGVSQKSEAQLQSDYERERNQIAQTQKGDAKIRQLSDLKIKYREAGLKV